MFLEVDLGREENVTSLRLDVAPDQGRTHWQLEGKASFGQWSVLSSAPEVSSQAKWMDLRKPAIEQLKRNGIYYIAIPEMNYAAPDLRNNMRGWGIHPMFQAGETTLYQIE
jgi:hypothetical protein